MASQAQEFSTKELSPETWPDFERLFSQGNGWDHCWCMAFQRARQSSRNEFPTRAEQSVQNHEEKRGLVQSGRAHGILVYAGGAPVGWCQFGSEDELYGIASRRKGSEPNAPKNDTELWRITCFVTDRKYRRRGVAGVALTAALAAIRKKGGGLVEAYPVAHWHVDRQLGRLIREYGRGSPEVREHLRSRSLPEGVFVQGIGPVQAVHGTFGNVSTQGTVSMFERAGFRAVAVIGKTHVAMQITL